MKIEKFVEQLKKQYPTANAYVVESKGKRKVSVNVSYSETGKIYAYSGTIVGIAERLGLIPDIDVNKESERVVSALLSGESPISYAHCSDTVRYTSGLRIDYRPSGVDDFDRALVEYFIDNSPNLWV